MKMLELGLHWISRITVSLSPFATKLLVISPKRTNMIGNPSDDPIAATIPITFKAISLFDAKRKRLIKDTGGSAGSSSSSLSFLFFLFLFCFFFFPSLLVSIISCSLLKTGSSLSNAALVWPPSSSLNGVVILRQMQRWCRVIGRVWRHLRLKWLEKNTQTFKIASGCIHRLLRVDYPTIRYRKQR